MTTATNPVLNYAQDLCTALTEDYNHQYPNGSDLGFRIESGRKYFKVIQTENRGGQRRDGSVHAFIDKKNGNVYKPASWKSPAKHVRYNLLDENSRNLCLNRASWAGGYLYLR